jgi:hypothetical protein
MTNSLIRLLQICVLAIGIASCCHAGVIYTFSYTAVRGPVQSFSFSFESPTFVTDLTSPAFTPFTVTDGANNWTFTKDLVSVVDPSSLNIGCFVFGTQFAGLGGPPPLFGPCSFSVGGPGVSEAAFDFLLNGGLPMAPGIYPARNFFGAFDTALGFEYIADMNDPTNPTGDMVLTISPEPSNLSLMLAVVSFMLMSGPSIRGRLNALRHSYSPSTSPPAAPPHSLGTPSASS